MRRRLSVARVLCAAGLILACGGGLFSQENDDPSLAGMSRQLRMGIRFFEKGDDMQAMDRFMEVLTQGEPAERSMANEYINLITHRMNTGEKGPPPQRPSSINPSETLVVAEQGSAPDQAAPPASRRPQAAAEPAMPAANKALMAKEIQAKLRARLEESLSELRRNEDVRLLLMSNGDPQAVAIPSPLLFQAGIAFQKDAGKILDALTKLIFSLGGAQAIILPEGTTIGDAKVLDMRRTMGISSHLFSAGVAPARVRVNLLNTQVDIPKPLQNFRGIVILFMHGQPMNLAVESAIGEEAGPPISLGLYPPTIRPDKGEGSVIEFSVQDPPAGLVSWKFQLLEPSEGGASELAPLQEVVGGSPVFHQIFWNGRRNYFGAPLPAGRYEAVLTATDSKNRQRTLHRWIQVLGSIGAAGPRSAAVEGQKAVPGAPSADLPAGKPRNAPSIKKPAAAKTKRAKARRPSKTAAGEKGAVPAARAENSAKPPASSYQLDFNKNTHQLTPEAEKHLAEIAGAVAYYPLESLKIDGSAQLDESNAAALADRRAKMVANLLINKYQIDPKKIRIASAVAGAPSFGVHVSFVKDE